MRMYFCNTPREPVSNKLQTIQEPVNNLLHAGLSTAGSDPRTSGYPVLAKTAIIRNHTARGTFAGSWGKNRALANIQGLA
jgi:hypothetical protein